MMSTKQITVLAGDYAVHRLAADASIPDTLLSVAPCWITRTDEELSIVCESHIRLDADKTNLGWRCLKIEGPLAFSEVGVLAGIATVLSDAGVSLIALSTFDTDYFLVKNELLNRSVDALGTSDWSVCI